MAPIVVGLNLTVIVQDPAGAIVTPQPFVTIANCVGLVPPSVTPDTTRLALPVLVTVMFCVAESVPVLTEPKTSEAGVTDAIGVDATPVPLKATLEGEPPNPSWIIPSVAVLKPVKVGANTTLMVQEAPGRTTPQSLACTAN